MDPSPEAAATCSRPGGPCASTVGGVWTGKEVHDALQRMTTVGAVRNNCLPIFSGIEPEDG